jgi:hypothetical protein
MNQEKTLNTYTPGEYDQAEADLHATAARLKEAGACRRYGVKLVPTRIGSMPAKKLVLVDRQSGPVGAPRPIVA